MNKGIMAVALIVATTGCTSTQKGVLSVRPVGEQATGPMKDALERGDTLFSRGEYALALDAFRRAVRADPADAHGLNGVAISYAAMGRHDLAREFFELALSRAPQDARIYRNFARSLSAQGLKGEAQALMAQAGDAGAGKAMTARPTLAQLAASAPDQRSAVIARPAALELERVSLGEVRLRTMADADGQKVARAEPMSPRLTASIVTVAQVQARPQLTAPIITVAAPEPAPVPQQTIAPPVQSPIAVVDAAPSGEQARGGLFERIWRGLTRPARRKDARG